MKCLNCGKDIEAKTERRKYCSDACKMKYFRKHGKKNELKPYQMKVLYDAILELISNPSNSQLGKIYPQLGITKEEVGSPQAISTTSKYSLGELKTFQQHMNEIAELQYEDEYRKKYAEIEAAENLSEKQKNLLYHNMKQSKL